MNSHQVIDRNVIQFMKTLCSSLPTLDLSDQVTHPQSVADVLAADSDHLLSSPAQSNPGVSIGKVVQELWENDPAIQAAWRHRSSLQLVEAHQHFLNNMETICAENYIPSVQDTILAHKGGTALLFMRLDDFSLYELGGHPHVSRWWRKNRLINGVEEDISAIVFVVSLSSYDQTFKDDIGETCNEMEESLEMFQWICKHPNFREQPIIILFNKADLLSAKITEFPISDVPSWADYDGGSDVTKACQYFHNRFDAESKQIDAKRPTYSHMTVAVDANSVKKEIGSCLDIARKHKRMGSGGSRE